MAPEGNELSPESPRSASNGREGLAEIAKALKVDGRKKKGQKIGSRPYPTKRRLDVEDFENEP